MAWPDRRIAACVDRQRLARRHPQLPLHQVEPGDHFSNRMLDLQPRIHLQEEEPACIGNELHRSGPDITNRLRRRDRRRPHLLPLRRRQPGRRRFLQHLLVAPLRRTVAFEQMHGVAVRVGEDLHLDMARPLQIAFDQHPVVAERRRRLLPRRLQCGGEIRGRCQRPACRARHRRRPP